MKKSTSWLLILCISAIAGVFLLQFFWIRNYYYVNKATFEKEVNLVFEDALGKELNVRCDTIENNVFHLLLDTNEFSLSNVYDDHRHAMMVHIINKRGKKDDFMFSMNDLLNEVKENDNGPAKIYLVKRLVSSIRAEDLMKHMVWYQTQRLGDFIQAQEHKYDFDTARLRPIFTKLLSQKDIHVSFAFYTRNNDSTYNNTNFNEGLISKYPVITRAHLTYKLKKNEHYVRAMFTNPFSYIITKMGLMFGASLLLIVVVAFSLFYLLRSLLTEKKLSLIKNDFISNITHELKTPIATVSAAVESLSDFDVLSDTEKTKRYLSHSKKELQRLSGLVDTILTSSLYENQQFDCNPEPFNIDEVMQGLLNNYKFGTPKPVIINYHNTTPTLKADKQLFAQVIANIIDNAIKYSSDDVTIDIRCTLSNNFFVIAIKDNGIGIQKKDMPYLFEKFYRVPTNKHLIKGHGLGLNYVKSIMERHKGWVRVESEFGEGTTITLGWPV